MKQDGNLRDLIDKVAHTEGWTVERSGSHVRLISPDGQVVISPSTTGDRRCWLNIRSCLRKIGWPD